MTDTPHIIFLPPKTVLHFHYLLLAFFFFFLMSMHQGDVTMDEKRNMGYMSQLDVVYPACRGVAQGKSNG
jgi:hypothetical protein